MMNLWISLCAGVINTGKSPITLSNSVTSYGGGKCVLTPRRDTDETSDATPYLVMTYGVVGGGAASRPNPLPEHDLRQSLFSLALALTVGGDCAIMVEPTHRLWRTTCVNLSSILSTFNTY